MKYLRVAALAGMASALMTLILNCHDRDVSQVTGPLREGPEDMQVATDRCVPGQTIACMGGCGEPQSGYQVCADDGRSYGPCICPPLRSLGPIPSPGGDGERHLVPGNLGGLPVTGTGGSGGNGTANNPAAGEGIVGAACRTNGDCMDGLSCLTAEAQSLGVGGPAGGYFSASCGSDAACQQIDPGSECIGFAGSNICVRRCASRPPSPGESKCLSRTDVMCVSVAALGQEPPGDTPQPGFCLPACQSDAQCGPGLFCDLGSGLCSNLRPEGDPVGSVCTDAQSCASGLCLTVNPQFKSFCSGFCRVGAPGCGFDGSEAQAGATCLFAQVRDEGAGDRGLCFEACDEDTDCREPGAVCVPPASSGRSGVCVVPVPPVTPPAGQVPSIGKACTTNTECGSGLTCLTPDSDPFGAGGGPAGGYCSATCAQGNPCPEPGALCVTTTGGNVCLAGCDPTDDAVDCGGRDTLVCDTFPNGDPTRGFCRPQCNVNAECGALSCDPVIGLCVDAPVPECAQDDDCGPGEICLTRLGTCVEEQPECSDDADCDGSQECDLESGTCVDPEPECSDDSDCDEGVCDAELGLCVASPPGCTSDDDCGAQVCDRARGICVDAPSGCTSNEDCETGVCDVSAGVCVPASPECTANEDCDGGEVCDEANGVCVAAPECTSDADCAPRLCDEARGVCVDVPACQVDDDCAEGICNQVDALCREAPAIPIGGACQTGADCAGELCPSFDGVNRFCTAFCLLGTPVGCEVYGSDAFCLLQDDPNDTQVGVCLELCDTAADCATPASDCLPFDGPINARLGVCLPPL